MAFCREMTLKPSLCDKAQKQLYANDCSLNFDLFWPVILPSTLKSEACERGASLGLAAFQLTDIQPTLPADVNPFGAPSSLFRPVNPSCLLSINILLAYFSS